MSSGLMLKPFDASELSGAMFFCSLIFTIVVVVFLGGYSDNSDYG